MNQREQYACGAARQVDKLEERPAGRRAMRKVSFRKRIARLNGWTVAWYAFLTLAGILLYKVGAVYALRERGYHAIGGEALALLLPVLYYTVEATIRDIVRDLGSRR